MKKMSFQKFDTYTRYTKFPPKFLSNSSLHFVEQIEDSFFFEKSVGTPRDLVNVGVVSAATLIDFTKFSFCTQIFWQKFISNPWFSYKSPFI